jgi:hypothetical protein
MKTDLNFPPILPLSNFLKIRLASIETENAESLEYTQELETDQQVNTRTSGSDRECHTEGKSSVQMTPIMFACGCFDLK